MPAAITSGTGSSGATSSSDDANQAFAKKAKDAKAVQGQVNEKGAQEMDQGAAGMKAGASIASFIPYAGPAISAGLQVGAAGVSAGAQAKRGNTGGAVTAGVSGAASIGSSAAKKTNEAANDADKKKT